MAARLLVKTHLEWYQLAHIAHDLLRTLPGHNRVYNTLRDEILRANGEDPPKTGARPKKPPAPTPKELEFIAELVGQGPGGVRGITVKRLLNARITQLESSSDTASKSFGAIGRLFLNLESGWRYAKDFRTSPKRVRDVLSVVSKQQAGGLADNAWLMLELAMKLALTQPRIPTRNLMESIAILLDAQFDVKQQPYEWLLQLGEGKGPSLLETIHASWVNLNQRVDKALKSLPDDPMSDAKRTYKRITRHLELRLPVVKATPEILHAFGEPIRETVVSDWLTTGNLPLPKSRRSLSLIEKSLRNLWTKSPERRPAVLVIAVLTIQHALALQMEEHVRGRALQLLDRGDYLRRSLILPGGRVSRAFPSNIQRCLERDNSNCLQELLDTLKKMAKTKRTRPNKKHQGPAAIRRRAKRQKRVQARPKRKKN
jgi:hypothetical protein